MNFQDLHEALRMEVERRITAGRLSGSVLARMTGFQQAHISNFLNRKRALSLEGLDRVLTAQNLSVEQILPLDLAAATAPPDQADPLESVPVVSAANALFDPRITPNSTVETVYLSAARLHGNRPRPTAQRQTWQRFVAVRLDAAQAAPMHPVLTQGALAVIDRHYNSVAPYRSTEPSIFAVRSGSALLFRYADLDENRLVLRPYSRTHPVQLIRLLQTESPANYIAGRLCQLITEL